MASAMAAAAAHAMPPFPLPAVPRVRPPAIPKGTPGPNTLPMPQKTPPKPHLVWVDGRWAHPESNSAKAKREVVSRQLEKALRHEVHGMNIYAYRHVKTNQVVYSLTKNMDNNKILKQLVFHGKKTVPNSLRRDMWRPYFSIHFPQNAAGAYKGLLVYQELRELSLKRQLDPPNHVKFTLETDVDNFKARWDPIKLKDKTEQETIKRGSKYHRWDIPVPGDKVTPRLLAKRLMNQRRTSVADLAAVLQRWTGQLQDGKLVPAVTPQQRLADSQARSKNQEALLSARAAGRLKTIRAEEQTKQEELQAREDYLTPRPGHVTVDRHSLSRISTEYDGRVGLRPGNSTELDMMEERDQTLLEQSSLQNAYNQALTEVQSEKDAKRDQIEARLSARIEKELSQLTEAERVKIQKSVEAQRAEAQKEIDKQLAAARDKLRADKESVQRTMQKAGRRDRQALATLRRLQRDKPKEILQLKIDLHNKLLKWAGPFAEINTQVEAAMVEIDEKHAPRLEELRQAASEHEKKLARALDSHEVEIRWADITDGTYAQEWPESVVHNQLQPKAVVQYNASTVRQYFHFDEGENPIEEQKATSSIPHSNSVHVFGSGVPDEADTSSTSRYMSPETANERFAAARQERIMEWTNTSNILLREKIVDLRRECNALETLFQDFPLDSVNLQTLSYVLIALSRAQEALQNMAQQSYEDEDLANIEMQLNYVRTNLPSARIEVTELANSSPTDFFPEAEDARIQWIEKQILLIEMEANNREAVSEANLRQEFLAKFDQREAIERRIRSYEPGAEHENHEMYEAAVADLGNFDREAPFIVEVLQRREKLSTQIEVLEQQVQQANQYLSTLSQTKATNESTQSTESGSASDKTTTKLERKTAQEAIATLREELNPLLKEQEMTSGDIRNDKKAWLEFRNAGGMTGYLGSVLDRDLKESEGRSRRAAQSERSGQQRQPQVSDEPVVITQRSVWGRVKELFGRR